MLKEAEKAFFSYFREPESLQDLLWFRKQYTAIESR